VKYLQDSCWRVTEIEFTLVSDRRVAVKAAIAAEPLMASGAQHRPSAFRHTSAPQPRLRRSARTCPQRCWRRLPTAEWSSRPSAFCPGFVRRTRKPISGLMATSSRGRYAKLKWCASVCGVSGCSIAAPLSRLTAEKTGAFGGLSETGVSARRGISFRAIRSSTGRQARDVTRSIPAAWR
jgi:hypothetical protein